VSVSSRTIKKIARMVAAAGANFARAQLSHSAQKKELAARLTRSPCGG
jgi:hypothetical protein